MTRLLHHLTLNTGHVASTPRSDVSLQATAILTPMIDAGGGQIPGLPGWHTVLARPTDDDGTMRDGGAYFQVADEAGWSKRPAVQGVACWSLVTQAQA